MGRGIIDAAKLRTERYKLTPRTSDPAATNEGEGWLREDVAPESNQIGTLRVDTGDSTIDVPILQTGTSANDVVEALRVQVGGATGYIPARPAGDAAFPALRLQHNGQVYGFHDNTGKFAFFDMAITATNAPVVEGDPLNVDYSVSNTGGSVDNTQDITLDVGSTERDRDSSVTVNAGGSTTGQLSWANTTSGSYTATVASDDDSASTSVSVEAAISVSGLAYYDVTAKDPSVNPNATWQDQLGSKDVSGPIEEFDPTAINGFGGIRLVDNFHELVNLTDFDNGQPLTVYFVIALNDTGGKQTIFATEESSTLGDGVSLEADFGSNEFAYYAGNVVSGGSPQSGRQVGTAQLNGSNSFLRINGSEVLSGNIGTQGLEGLRIGNRGLADRPLGGEIGLFNPVGAAESLSTIEAREQKLNDKFGLSVI